MGRRVLCCILLFLLSAISLFGQASASLNGRVTDPQGDALVGAAVTVTNATNGMARDTVTTGEGLYNVPSLVPGNYTVKVTAQNRVHYYKSPTAQECPRALATRAAAICSC